MKGKPNWRFWAVTWPSTHSMGDLDVVTPPVTAKRAWDSSFCRDGPFPLRMRPPIPLRDIWKFLHTLIIILIQLLFIYLFIAYNTKPSNCEASHLEIWEIWSTVLLPFIQSPLWLREIVSVNVHFMGEIEIFINFLLLKLLNCVQTNDC